MRANAATALERPKPPYVTNGILRAGKDSRVACNHLRGKAFSAA